MPNDWQPDTFDGTELLGFASLMCGANRREIDGAVFILHTLLVHEGRKV